MKHVGTIKRRSVLALFLTAGSVLTVACGSGAQSSSATNELQQIKTAGVIKIGIAVDPPFTYRQANGDWTSFEPSMDRLLCTKLGVTCDFIAEGWSTIVAGLLSGKYDIIGASIAATAAREKVIAFTTFVTETGTTYIVRKDNPKSLTTLASLNNPNVVVSFSANSEDYYNTKQFLPQAAERALTNATVADEIAEVESGHADADGLCSCLATALTTLFPWAAAVPTPPSSGLYGGVGSVGVSWGVRKGNPQLVAYLNTFISAEIANGTVRTLLETMQLPTA